MKKMKRLLSRIMVAMLLISMISSYATPVYAAGTLYDAGVTENEPASEDITDDEKDEEISEETDSDAEDVSEKESEDASEETGSEEDTSEESASEEATSEKDPKDVDDEDEMLRDGDIPIDSDHFPDPDFNMYVYSHFGGGDDVLTEAERNAVEEIDVSGFRLNNVKGIEYFPNLKTLDCSGNNIEELDFSKNTALTKLNIIDNKITSISFDANTNIEELYVGKNPLGSLDVSVLSNLRKLECRCCNLQSLDVSQNHELTSLVCDGNNLTKLDISKLEDMLESMQDSVRYKDFGSYDPWGGYIGTCTAYLIDAELKTVLYVDEDTTLVPSYEEIMAALDEYSVTFIVDDNYETIKVKKGDKAKKPVPNPVKDGYIFSGWFADIAHTVLYDFDTPLNCNIALRAGFDVGTVKIHTVYYIDGSTTYRTVRVAREDVVEDIKLPDKGSVTFVGWYRDTDFTQKYDFSTPVTSSFKLYAKWSNDYSKWTVKFMDGSTVLKTEKINEGSKVKSFPATKEGYKLLGWYKDAGLKTAYDFNTPVTSNLTLYAKWEKLIPTFSVTDFGAKPNDNVDDYNAFKTALAKASSYDELIIVKVPAGTYLISQSLMIQSDTRLVLDPNATIKSISTTGYVPMAMADPGKNAGKGGYGQFTNIEIEGGTWDRNSASNVIDSIFVFRHGSNLKIHDMTVKSCTDHMINVSASQNVEIKNVTFTNHIAYTGTDPDFWGGHPVGDKTRYGFVEVVHTDFAGSGEPDISPADGTACRNITVSNCKFMSTLAGVGTHHSTSSSKGDGITVTGCTFSQIQYGAILNAWSLTNVNFSNNTASYNNADRDAAFIITEGTTGKAENNTVTSPGVLGFKILNSTFSANKNTISGATNYGIFAEGGNVTASGNTISGSGLNGINISACASATLDGNTVTNSERYGIYVYNCGSGVTVINNKVSGTNEGFGIIVENCNGKTDLSEGYYVRNGNSYKGYNYIAANTVTIGRWGGLYVYNCCAVLIGNSVTNCPFDAIQTKGEGKTVTFEMKYNYVQGARYDIYLGDNSVNCRLIENTYAGGGVGLGNNSSYNEMLDFTSNSVSVSAITQYMVYTGSPVKQNLTITRGGERLTENVDYTATYTNNVNVGKATLTLAGKGKYSGTRVYTFWVLKADSVCFKFSDIKPDDWFVESVQYVTDRGIMTGMGTTFAPNSKVTREQVTQMLYAKEGKPKVTIANPFSDVKDAWYKNSVLWAYDKKIASGKPDGTFGVGKPITRMDFAIILYSYASYKKYNLNKSDTAINSFADASKVKDYGKNAMNWAVTQGIISGKGGNRLDPTGNATRAECATMVMQLLKKNGQK